MYPEFIARLKIHTKTQAYIHNLKCAIKTITKAQAIGKFAISWSGGKDSTAMCHLIKSLYTETPIIIQFDDCDWPEKHPYIERVSKIQRWDYYSVNPDFSVWEEACKGHIGYDDFCSKSHPLTKNGFVRLLEKERERLSCVGSYLGLRIQESRARRLNYIERGDFYRMNNGIWHCCPLSRWTTEDVFAYLLEHNVEINPCYFNNKLRSPFDIRLAWALPTPRGITEGDMEHIRRYYPAQYCKLRERGIV